MSVAGAVRRALERVKEEASLPVAERYYKNTGRDYPDARAAGFVDGMHRAESILLCELARLLS